MDVIKPAETECGQNRILVDRHTPTIAQDQQPAVVDLPEISVFCWMLS